MKSSDAGDAKPSGKGESAKSDSSETRASQLQPIFIGGCPRSGTTMLGSILGAGADSICTPESQFLTSLLRACTESRDATSERGHALTEAHRGLADSFRYRLWAIGDPPALEAGLPPEQALRHFVEEIVRCIGAAHDKPDPRFWIDHTPANIHRTESLLQVFPNARFIHVVRDGRAVAASWRNVTWGSQTPKKQAWVWQNELAAGLAMETRYGPDVARRVRYEDVVGQPDVVLPELFEWCGIRWSGDALEGGEFRAMPSYTRGQHKLVGRAPDPRRIHAWKKQLSARHVELFEYFAVTALTLLGYETLHARPVGPSAAERVGMEVAERLLRVKLSMEDRSRRKRALRTGES